MPGTTPNRLYPYPLPADTINVPRDIEALARAVDGEMSGAFRRDVDRFEVRKFSPTGNSDVTGTTMLDWLITTASIPDWAKDVSITTTLAGLYQANGTSSSFELQLHLGTLYGTKVYHGPMSVSNRQTLTWVDSIILTAGTGAQNIAIMGRRSLGDGALRMDGACTVMIDLHYGA